MQNSFNANKAIFVVVWALFSNSTNEASFLMHMDENIPLIVTT
jgi:hypothetical protein